MQTYPRIASGIHAWLAALEFKTKTPAPIKFLHPNLTLQHSVAIDAP